MQEIPYMSKHYGLGLMINHTMELDAIGHNGSVPGYTSRFAINQDTGFAMIIFRNYNRGVTDLDKISLDLVTRLK